MKIILLGVAVVLAGMALGVVVQRFRAQSPNIAMAPEAPVEELPAKRPVEKRIVVPAPKAAPIVSVTPAAAVPPGPPEIENPKIAAPVVPQFTALDLSPAFNSNLLSRFIRAAEGSEEGIPHDGRVAIPGILPRAYFVLSATQTRNALEIGTSRVFESITFESDGGMNFVFAISAIDTEERPFRN